MYNVKMSPLKALIITPCSKSMTSIGSNPHINTVRQVLLLSPLHFGNEEAAAQRAINTQLTGSKTMIHTETIMFQKPCF